MTVTDLLETTEGRTSQARDDLFLELIWNASSSAICHQGKKNSAWIVKTDARRRLDKELKLEKEEEDSFRTPLLSRCCGCWRGVKAN